MLVSHIMLWYYIFLAGRQPMKPRNGSVSHLAQSKLILSKQKKSGK